MTNKKPSIKTKRMRVQLAILGGIVGVPLLIAGVWWGVDVFLDARDRKAFLAAEHDVNVLASTFKSEVPYLDWQLDSSCDRPSVKFSTDPSAVCSSAIQFKKTVDSQNEVQHIIDEIHDVLAESDLYPTSTLDYPDMNKNDAVGYGSNDLYSPTDNIHCDAFYEIEKATDLILEGTIGCSGQARDAWFPIR